MSNRWIKTEHQLIRVDQIAVIDIDRQAVYESYSVWVYLVGGNTAIQLESFATEIEAAAYVEKLCDQIKALEKKRASDE